MKQFFPCTQCGLCCQFVDRSDETRFLDRGDGTCKHYDENSRCCKIYNERPEICSVEVMYKKHYAALYDWDQFVELNMKVCHELQLVDQRKLRHTYKNTTMKG